MRTMENLRTYENASSQYEVNFTKLVAIFTPNIDIYMRKVIFCALGMREGQDNGSYLGLRRHIERNKRKTFYYLQVIVQKKSQ